VSVLWPVNEERVQVRVLPFAGGVKNGPAACGLKARANLQPGTAARGDLYLNLRLEDHPIWKARRRTVARRAAAEP